MDNIDFKLTDQDLSKSSLIFCITGIIFIVSLIYLVDENKIRGAAKEVILTSAVFWGIIAYVAMKYFWEMYYVYFYADILRKLVPFNIIIYAGITIVLWLLALRLPVSTLLWFVLLGGIEGVIEHIIGIYIFDILNKVPWLSDVTPLPVIIFSFFEYVVYWSIVAWLSVGVIKIYRIFNNGY